jgi:hypothetical protein
MIQTSSVVFLSPSKQNWDNTSNQVKTAYFHIPSKFIVSLLVLLLKAV